MSKESDMKLAQIQANATAGRPDNAINARAMVEVLGQMSIGGTGTPAQSSQRNRPHGFEHK